MGTEQSLYTFLVQVTAVEAVMVDTEGNPGLGEEDGFVELEEMPELQGEETGTERLGTVTEAVLELLGVFVLESDGEHVPAAVVVEGDRVPEVWREEDTELLP